MRHKQKIERTEEKKIDRGFKIKEKKAIDFGITCSPHLINNRKFVEDCQE